ncbi:MAG: DUF2141 domain-containing protein [Pseudomonadota bacterium]
MSGLKSIVVAAIAALWVSHVAFADMAGPLNLFSIRAAYDHPVAAVQTTFDAEAGQAVRVSIYKSEDAFLQTAYSKREGQIDASGVAIVPLNNLAPGEYAFAAYLDENGDGVLNRGKILGRPKEPVAFSNGVKPKLGKPDFNDAKVTVEPDSVVVITLDN